MGAPAEQLGGAPPQAGPPSPVTPPAGRHSHTTPGRSLLPVSLASPWAEQQTAWTRGLLRHRALCRELRGRPGSLPFGSLWGDGSSALSRVTSGGTVPLLRPGSLWVGGQFLCSVSQLSEPLWRTPGVLRQEGQNPSPLAVTIPLKSFRVQTSPAKEWGRLPRPLGRACGLQKYVPLWNVMKSIVPHSADNYRYFKYGVEFPFNLGCDKYSLARSDPKFLTSCCPDLNFFCVLCLFLRSFPRALQMLVLTYYLLFLVRLLCL